MRFDPAPLVAAVGDLSIHEVQEVIGVNSRTWSRYRNGTGTISMDMADKYAVRLGMHPGEIWPEWWEVAS